MEYVLDSFVCSVVVAVVLKFVSNAIRVYPLMHKIVKKLDRGKRKVSAESMDDRLTICSATRLCRKAYRLTVK